MELKEQPQILGVVTINGTDAEYVKYDRGQIINLMKYVQRQSGIENIVLQGYADIRGRDKKVIVFPKNSVVSYMNS